MGNGDLSAWGAVDREAVVAADVPVNCLATDPTRNFAPTLVGTSCSRLAISSAFWPATSTTPLKSLELTN